MRELIQTMLKVIDYEPLKTQGVSDAESEMKLGFKRGDRVRVRNGWAGRYSNMFVDDVIAISDIRVGSNEYVVTVDMAGELHSVAAKDVSLLPN